MEALQGRLMLGFKDVLILIIMEDTHGDPRETYVGLC